MGSQENILIFVDQRLLLIRLFPQMFFCCEPRQENSVLFLERQAIYTLHVVKVTTNVLKDQLSTRNSYNHQALNFYQSSKFQENSTIYNDLGPRDKVPQGNAWKNLSFVGSQLHNNMV